MAWQVEGGLVQIQAGAPLGFFDIFVQSGNTEGRGLPPVGLQVQAAHVVEGHVGNGSRSVCHAVNRGVVHHHEVAVLCLADVGLDNVSSEKQGIAQCLQGVFRCILPVGTMGRNEDMTVRHCAAQWALAVDGYACCDK